LKTGNLQAGWSVAAKFSRERDLPTNHFCTDTLANKCLRTLLLIVFTQRNLQQTFFKQSAILHGTWPCFFEPSFGGLGATYDYHLRLIGKHAVDFLLALSELLLLGANAEALRANID